MGTQSTWEMRSMFKTSLYILLLRVSLVKQQSIKIIIIVEFMYLCVIGLLLRKVRR